jgi:CIC family chloride channel protein
VSALLYAGGRTSIAGSSNVPTAPAENGRNPAANRPVPAVPRLGDFTTDPRLLVLTLMALVVGALGALVAYALVWLIGAITNLVYYHRLSATLVSPAANALGLWAVLIPMAGGIVIGLMARYGSERIRGHGIPEAMEAILIGRSRMDPKVAILKPISSAISIGTGGPFGAEGPIIMTGGAFGSLFAQAFHLSAAERKTLLVAGAAAGMAAIFATPLAAVLIAVELLLFEWKPRSFVPVAAAAAIAAALRVPLLGAGPIFPIPPHGMMTSLELLTSLGIGVAAMLASALLTGLVYGAEDLFLKLPIHFMWWPVIGGLVVGLGGLVEPRALGVGYDTIRDLLDGHLLGAAVLGLLVTKAIIWSVALGSGTSGGVLAPLLIIGGALGAAEAPWIHGGDPALWTLVSMAALMGGTMRSPLTSIAFVIELTHDLNTLPALIVGCVAAHAVTVLLMKRSILTEKVARRGYHVVREYSVSPLVRFRVEDVMERDVPTIPAEIHVDDMLRRLLTHDAVLGRRNAWPLVDESGRLVGLLTRSDLLSAIDRDEEREPTVLEIGSRDLVVAYTDDLLSDALDTMIRAGFSRLPVVDRDEPTRLVGMISRDGLAAAYRAVLEEEYLRERGIGLTMPRFLVRRRGAMRASQAAKTEPAAVASGNGAMSASEPTEKVQC